MLMQQSPHCRSIHVGKTASNTKPFSHIVSLQKSFEAFAAEKLVKQLHTLISPCQDNRRPVVCRGMFRLPAHHASQDIMTLGGVKSRNVPQTLKRSCPNQPSRSTVAVMNQRPNKARSFARRMLRDCKIVAS